VGVHTDIISMNPLELLARTGFLVKGLLYIVIGVLALQVATGLGGRVTGTRGALMTVLGQPFGRTLLLIAAISLFGYAVWRVLQGPPRFGRAGTRMARDCVARELRRTWRSVRGAGAAGGSHLPWAVAVIRHQRARNSRRSVPVAIR
jgi:hypothetical protein